MILSSVHIKGFRNFKDATINLSNKSLIIGGNEIGKTNFINALRFILDENLPPTFYEPDDSDFFTYEQTNQFSITLKFIQVKEECVVAQMRGNISDNEELFIRYEATRDPETKRKTFFFSSGKDLDNMETINYRFYLKALNLQFIGSKRDLFAFIRRERKNLLQDAKFARTEEEIQSDSSELIKIEQQLIDLQRDITSLAFVKKATENLNKELKELSSLNDGHEVKFDTGNSDASLYIDDLSLSTEVNENILSIGGEGRNNQIQLLCGLLGIGPF